MAAKSIEDLLDGRRIIIRPIERNPALEGVSGGGVYPGGPVVLRAVIDGTKHKYKVGLSASEISILSKALGVEIDLTYRPDQPNWFWDVNPRTQVILEYDTNVIELKDDPYKYIHYKIVQNHPLVAPSKDDLGRYPDARFYIYDEQQEQRKAVRQYVEKKTAYDLIGKLTREQKDVLLTVISGVNPALLTNDGVDARLYQLAETPKTRKLLVDYGQILQGKDSDSKTHLVNRALVARALMAGVAKRNRDGTIYWEGRTYDGEAEMAAWLSKPENNAFMVSLSEKVAQMSRQ